MGNSLLMTLAMKPEEAHRYPQPWVLAACLQARPPQETWEGPQKMAELQNLMLAMGPLHYCRDIHSEIVNDHSLEPNELNTWVRS